MILKLKIRTTKDNGKEHWQQYVVPDVINGTTIRLKDGMKEGKRGRNLLFITAYEDKR